MSEWKHCKLGEVAEVQTGPFGSQLKNEQYITNGTPVVTVEHIRDFRIIDFNYPSVTEYDKQRLLKYTLKTGDIIFTRVGSVDLSAYVKPHQDGWMFSSRMLRVRPKHNVDSRFLSYFFQQKSFREYILNISVGATMPSINTEILKGIPVAYPSLTEQKAIASVLSSLDDKIDLLHRQNKTLEAMAETLFRQWFVVEADEDWEERTLESVSSRIASGGTPLTSIESYYNGNITWFTTKEFHDAYLYDSDVKISQDGLYNSSAKVFPKNAIVIAMYGATVGAMGILAVEAAFNQATCGIVVDEDLVPFEYIYLLLRYRRKEIIDFATGSAQQNLNVRMIRHFKILIPMKEKVKKFKDIVKPIYFKIENNSAQIRTLEKLRDTLLPKLMSEEVIVKL